MWFHPADERDRGDEFVSSPGNIDNEPVSVLSVSQRATQRRNVDAEIGRLDKNTRPNASHQFILADQFTWAFEQNNQDFQSPTSKGHSSETFQQKKLCWEQAKRSKQNFGWCSRD
jgi:hypothetical protein